MEESHPVPQNVTAFQFHLVGDMTLKQFGYLAVGLGIAYLIFILLFSAAPIIAVPLIIFFASLGAAFAFLPILDRPLDHWVKAYFKAIYSPTKGRWGPLNNPQYKVNPNDKVFKDRLKTYLASMPQKKTEGGVIEIAKTPLSDKKEAASTPNLRPLKTPPPPPKPLTKADFLPHTQATPAILPSISPKPEPIHLFTPPPPPPPSHTSHPSDLTANIDFSPQHNPSLQHLQYIYTPPNSSPIENIKPQINPLIEPHININIPITKPSVPSPSNLPITLPKAEPAHSFTPPPQPQSQPKVPFIEHSQHNQAQSQSVPIVTPKELPKLPSSEELNKVVDIAKQARTLQVKLSEAEKQINQLTLSATAPENKEGDYKHKFNQVFTNLQTLIHQTDTLTKQAQEANKIVAPAFPPPTIVKVVGPPKAQPTQPLLTSQPNVVNGIVTDSSGNYLEGVIIIIHDKDGLPVRALKSNKIGQFTGTTPLPSGVYTITLEKDNLEFDTLEVNLNNEVMPPLQISAKRKGVS